VQRACTHPVHPLATPMHSSRQALALYAINSTVVKQLVTKVKIFSRMQFVFVMHPDHV